MLPVKLDQSAIDVAIQSLPVNFAQAKRMLQYLGSNPNAVTVDVNRECAAGNLSDVARKANRYLLKHHLFIGCHRPVRPINNRFGEQSQMYEWGIYSLPMESANDDRY
jgi:hypothetical protein